MRFQLARVACVVLLAASAWACATPSLPALRLGGGAALVDGELAQALELGGQGELTLYPRLLATTQDAAPAPPEAVRLQVLVRAIREDGGVMTWSVGAEGRAPAGEGGRRWRPEARRGLRGMPLGGARIGPLSVGKIVALEALAGWVQGPPQRTLHEQGIRALGSAPLASATASDWAKFSAEVAGLGAAPLLALRIPLSHKGQRAPGVYTFRLALVSVGPQGSPPVVRRFVDSSDEDVPPWPIDVGSEDITLLTVDVELRVD